MTIHLQGFHFLLPILLFVGGHNCHILRMGESNTLIYMEGDISIIKCYNLVLQLRKSFPIQVIFTDTSILCNTKTGQIDFCEY